MSRDAFSFFQLKTFHGRWLSTDPDTGKLCQIAVPTDNKRLILLVQPKRHTSVAFLIATAIDISSLYVSNSHIMSPVLPVVVVPGALLGTVALRETVTGRFLRSADDGVNVPTIDLAAISANAWEYFELRRVEIPTIDLSERFPALVGALETDLSAEKLDNWIRSTSSSSLDKSLISLLLCLPETGRLRLAQTVGKIIAEDNSETSATLKIVFSEYLLIAERREFLAAVDLLSDACKSLTDCYGNIISEKSLDRLLEDTTAAQKLPSGLLTIFRNSTEFHIEKRRRALTERKLSYFVVPEGLVSGDGTTVLGGDGHIFLAGGSNSLRELYDLDEQEESTRKQVEGWIELIIRRRLNVVSIGCKYVHMIIPEKATVLDHLYPEPLTTPTAYLRGFEKGVASTVASENYISILDLFKGGEPQEIYKRIDTHLQPRGAFAVLSGFVERYLDKVIETPIFDDISTLPGDMGGRYFGDWLTGLYVATTAPSFCEGRKLIYERAAAPGRHIGQQTAWLNPLAPIKRKVIAFGNSFFGSCLDQGCLGWWFSNYFMEFHHVWSPELDYAYVRQHSPDYVITQTAERFMTRLPSD